MPKMKQQFALSILILAALVFVIGASYLAYADNHNWADVGVMWAITLGITGGLYVVFWALGVVMAEKNERMRK